MNGKIDNPELARGYQYDFSSRGTTMHDVHGREQKARTMIAVLQDYFNRPLSSMKLLNVGGSTGIIDNFLADYFQTVVGIDIDVNAIEHARCTYKKENLSFLVADAMELKFANDTYDVVICSQIYEHVSNAEIMMKEIFRVLKSGGVCYFAANNRLMWKEPHYGLPLLSVIPRRIAHIYIRAAGKADYYHELHYTYWGLCRLIQQFEVHDYTHKIVTTPEKYCADYMVKPGTIKSFVASFIVEYLYWLMPGYIWVLQKPRQNKT